MERKGKGRQHKRRTANPFLSLLSGTGPGCVWALFHVLVSQPINNTGPDFKYRPVLSSKPKCNSQSQSILGLGPAGPGIRSVEVGTKLVGPDLSRRLQSHHNLDAHNNGGIRLPRLLYRPGTAICFVVISILG